MAFEDTRPRREMTRMSCPACGTEVLSPTLSAAEMLDRHLRHCRWESEPGA